MMNALFSSKGDGTKLLNRVYNTIVLAGTPSLLCTNGNTTQPSNSEVECSHT